MDEPEQHDHNMSGTGGEQGVATSKLKPLNGTEPVSELIVWLAGFEQAYQHKLHYATYHTSVPTTVS